MIRHIGDATGAVSNGDTLGDIRFGGSDGTDMHNTAVAILMIVDTLSVVTHCQLSCV